MSRRDWHDNPHGIRRRTIDKARVNISDPKANMYGCLPCPECRSEYRFTAKARYMPELTGKTVVVCDNCCHEQEVE